jgi:Na+/H+ antiporter NhaC
MGPLRYSRREGGSREEDAMFDLPMFTLIHVVISVLGIITGLVVVGGLASGARLDGWTAIFLVTTVVTSATGFGFPFTKVQPPHVVGALSLAVLALCLVARYGKQMAGAWRTTYVVTAVVALYLNVFVLIVQLFVKTPPLAQLAPTQQEAPFALTQALVLALFVWLGYSAQRGFRRAGART